MVKLKVKTGDEVLVISGDDKGKKGVVKAIAPKKSILIVEGVNFIKRAVKPEHNNNKNYLEIERPIHISKVKVVNKKNNKVKKEVNKKVK